MRVASTVLCVTALCWVKVEPGTTCCCIDASAQLKWMKRQRVVLMGPDKALCHVLVSTDTLNASPSSVRWTYWMMWLLYIPTRCPHQCIPPCFFLFFFKARMLKASAFVQPFSCLDRFNFVTLSCIKSFCEIGEWVREGVTHNCTV